MPLIMKCTGKDCNTQANMYMSVLDLQTHDGFKGAWCDECAIRFFAGSLERLTKGIIKPRGARPHGNAQGQQAGRPRERTRGGKR